ncbi:MAG: hypothetical protein ACOY4W_08570 [Thermodesulfobacteriota bacterium]
MEPEFKLTDGFVSVIRRKAGKAFEAVGGKITPEVTEQDGTRLALNRHQGQILHNCLEEWAIDDLMEIEGGSAHQVPGPGTKASV